VGSEIVFTRDNNCINWANTIVFGLFHVGAIVGLFLFEWKAALVAVALYWIAISWGVGMGYHRLLTHRSYEVPKPVEYFLAVCATLALEGGPIFWVATHRIHHQRSDQEGDPHSPRDGKWWSHMGWILTGESGHNATARMGRYAPDLAKDPFHVWLNTYHYVPLIVLGLVLFAVGGLPMLLWGLCVRLVIGLHSTWFVNSASHIWGKRRFETRDDSRNNWWVALLTFGEGWHNNHHAHPTSARHGLGRYELDLTWIQIEILRLFGIAKSVKIAKIDHAVPAQKAA
jgi:stearoyl-CoA desaturase (delta-9 desaturase)